MKGFWLGKKKLCDSNHAFIPYLHTIYLKNKENYKKKIMGFFSNENEINFFFRNNIIIKIKNRKCTYFWEIYLFFEKMKSTFLFLEK